MILRLHYQRFLLCLVCIVVSNSTNAQTQKDTLQLLLSYQAIFEKAGKKLQERDIDSAIFFADQSKKFAEEHLGKKAYGLYAQTILIISIIYQAEHDYENAKKATNEYLQITNKNSGKNNTEYLYGLNTLASLYLTLNDYAKAEETTKEAMQLCEALMGKENKVYIRLLKLYTQIFSAIQNDDKAAAFQKEALLIETKLADTNPEEKVNLLSDLAKIYQNEKNFKKADSLYNIVLAELEKQSGKESYGYAMILESIGSMNLNAGDVEKAKQNYLRAAAILKNNKGTQLDYAYSAMILGGIYLQEKNYTLAENYYLQNLKITEAVSGKETLNYLIALTKLEHLYRQWGNVEKTVFYTALQIENWRQRWIRSFATFTESEKANSLEGEIAYMDFAFSVLYDLDASHAKNLAPLLFNINNDIDGLLLQNNSRITQFVKAKKDTTLTKLYNTWINYKTQYSKALQLSADQQQKQNLDSKELETKIIQQEKQLLRYDPNLQNIFVYDTLSTKKIISRLNAGEVLIKWVNFQYNSGDRFTDSLYYGAFVALPGNDPVFVKVCEQRKLKELLRLYYNAGDRGAEENADTLLVNRDSLHFYLYNLLWKPLLPFIGIAKTIYIVPSGQIHRISFAALQNEKGRSLFDIYGLHQLLSAREILNDQVAIKNRSALVFGGVDFSSEEPGSIKNNIKDTAQKDFITYNTTRGGSFNALPGTLNEVYAIKNILAGNKWHVQLFTGKKASKLNFIENIISGNCSILHLATHGFYFPPKQNKKNTNETFNEKIKFTDKPLLRSGIVFSGVNKYWSNNTMTQTNNNGIVTAQEIANLDLSKSSLVVLSACETALGDINSTEGVYGLQRGFKMAGINKMIMSLWPVPDKETSELMQSFYANVARGQSFYTAFYNARSIIKQKYKDPYKWAGFVLIGE